MKVSEILTRYAKTPEGKDGTDKNSRHSYGPVYDYIFRPFENRSDVDIVEIGIRGGWSILAWREFFPKATICGIDIVDPDPIENKIDGVEFIISDVKELKPNKEFDIVIDDGSHKLKDVLHVVENFKLKVGGVMVIEDIQKPDKWLPEIKKATKYSVEYIDLRENKGLHDDSLAVLRNYGFNF